MTAYPPTAPIISANPQSQAVPPGNSATFTVVADGSAPLSYQWYFNTSSPVGNATNATLTITSVQSTNTGSYSVIVGNSAGTATSTNAMLTLALAPVAGFTASPTNGTEPLAVTFTDQSTGSPLPSLSWDFGDNTTTNTTSGASFAHTYAAGAYTVTLTASNSVNTSTLVSNNLITVITALQAWQLQYFGCTNCAQADPNADPYGKGMSNFNQFLAGLNPTNPASLLQIISTAQNTTDVVIVWKTAGVRTNVVQATAGAPDGSYRTNGFADISGPVILGVVGDTTTNYTDVGGATNNPSHYYRIRLVP
jgi:PKD repeat protein